MIHIGLSGLPVINGAMWLAIIPSLEGVQRVRVLETTQYTALVEITEHLEHLPYGDAHVRRSNRRFMIAMDNSNANHIQFIEPTK